MGTHSEYGPYEYLTNSDVGYWDGTTHNDQWTVGPVNRGFKDKADVTHSDRIRATPWYRENVQIVEDSPMKLHYRWSREDNGQLIADYVSTRYLSSGMSDPAFWYPPDGYFPIAQNVSDRVSNQARNNLSKGGFETGVAIGESVATAEMLGDAGKKLAQAVIHRQRMLSGLPLGRRALYAKLSGAWLEGYYGWGSLVRDGFDLYQQLKAITSESEQVIKTGSKGQDTYSNVFGEQNQNSSKWTHKSEVGYRYTISDHVSKSMNDWGLANPVSIAWELVPLSFCIDWFVPIGNTLSALSATAGLEFMDGYHTEITEAEYEYRGNRPENSALVDFDPGSYKGRIFKMIRGKLNDFEPPKLYANRNPFSTNRINSAIALITQAALGPRS
jgi:hypothetical protein